MLSIDEAIAHALEVAGEQQKRADSAELIDVLDGLDVEACKECAADHRQLAEWLTDYKELKNSIGAVKLSNMKEALELIREYKAENVMLREFNDKIYDVLAKQFGSPCSCNYAVDEYMRKNGSCDDCGVEIPDKECWSRYIQTKLIGGAENG